MAVSPTELVVYAIGFVLMVILTPIGMAIIVATSTTSWNASVVTIFQVLLPVLYIIGSAIHFIPKIGKEK
jgi:heme/copper-type cytochrome/quinol oxidase subunit 4